MYSVSADYLTALSAPVKKFRLTGSVGSFSFTQANIIENTFSIVNRVSEGSEVKLGSVYIGQLKATFTGLNIARGAWLGKVITVSEGLQLADESYEDVPLGIYTIADAKHTLEGVEVVAYDAMSKMDKGFRIDQTNGEPFDLLSLACDKCGVTLAQTRVQIESFPNGGETFYLPSESDIETWRDFVSWIAQTLASVATINRDGELELRQYSTTSSATIDETQRFSGCSFSDFAVKYTGCSVVKVEEGITHYVSVTPDDGLTYNLGQNPFLQGDDDTMQQALINSFSAVQLVPFSAQMLGGAIYDLCDCLTFTGGVAAGAKVGVMGYSYSYNGGYKVEGYGSNPDLANARSKTDKDISGLIGQMDLDKPRIFAYTNSTAVTIADGDTETVCYLHVVAKKMTRFVLQLEVNHLAETTETETASTYTNTDLNITGKIYINDVLQDFSPVEVEQDGTQGYFLTFTEQVPQQGMEVRVDLACSGGNISVAIGDVQAYLMGPGFDDFKIESITITSLPNNLFPYGLVNYDGLVIDGVFNDGSQLDVTDDCTITPAEGTAISGDAEVVHMTANYNNGQFTEEFDAPVNPLFITRGEQNGNLFNGSTLPDETIEVGGDAYAIRSTKANAGSSKSYTLSYANFVLDTDGRPTYPSVKSSFYSGFPADTASDYTFDVFRDGVKWYITSGRYWIDIVRGFDFETLTDISVQPTFHDNGQYPSTIEGVRSSDHVLSGSDGLGFMLDGYMFYPDLGVKCTGQYTTIGSIGYGIIENGAVDIYLVRQARYTNVRTVDNLRATFTADGLKIERLHFNPIDLLTYEEIVTVPGVSGSSVWGWKVAGSTNLYVFYDASTKVIVDASTGRFIVVSSTDDAFDLIDQRTTYDPDRGIYITMARDTEHQYTYRMHLMWFSHDLVTWFRGGYLAPVGMADSYDLNRSTNLAHLGDFLVGAVDPVDSYIAGFSVEFQTEV